MGKIVMITALSAVLLRMADNHLYYGKYGDAAMFMARDYCVGSGGKMIRDDGATPRFNDGRCSSALCENPSPHDQDNS
ncbi:MAG: hypothetical protein JO314_03515 [Acidobacteria bacterium]|nr:hypothetical protein [Acidobacteriota bacterium]